MHRARTDPGLSGGFEIRHLEEEWWIFLDSRDAGGSFVFRGQTGLGSYPRMRCR